MREYQYDLQQYMQFCGWELERALSPSVMRAWRAHMVEVEMLAAATINRRLAAIKTVLRTSVAQQTIDLATAYSLSLVEKVRPQTLADRTRHAPHVLTPAEVRRIWRQPDPCTRKGVRDRALLATLAASGCRISEVVSLKRTDIYWRGTQGTITVLGKNQTTPRWAPLTAFAYTWITLWLERRAAMGIDVEMIFTAFTGRAQHLSSKPLSRDAAYRVVKDAARAAGLPNVTPHDFRRFVGTQLHESHGLIVAQQALGHKRSETTTRYIQTQTTMEKLTEGQWSD
jgi:integrase